MQLIGFFLALLCLASCSRDDCIVAIIDDVPLTRIQAERIADNIQPKPPKEEASRFALDVMLVAAESPSADVSLIQNYRGYLAKLRKRKRDPVEHFKELRKKHRVQTGECYFETK